MILTTPKVLIPVTVLVQTKNEAVGIRDCLKSLGDFDEVIVVDSNSVDETKSIARESGAAVVNFTWNGLYPKKKQWQLENLATKHPWVLFLDADESPSAALINELRLLGLSENTDFGAFDLRLDYAFAGRVLRHGHRVVKRALVHRNRVEFPVMNDLDASGMGELEGHYQPTVQGKVGRLNGHILHDDQDPVRTWFDRHNRYSDWEAHIRRTTGTKRDIASSRSRQGEIFDRLPLKPLVFFLYSYVLRRGFMDGRAGFDYAFALSAYYWQIGLKTRELDRANSHSTPERIGQTK
jgi:glycosyltransferase involved in cell wall biosynthesis